MSLLGVVLLPLGLLFTFLIPGFLVIEIFFPHLKKIEKIPLYLILSVLLSTYVVYLVSLIIGFSRLSILISFSLFLLLFPFLKKQDRKSSSLKKHRVGLIVALLVSLIFFIALYPAIFSRHRDYFVMSAVNWQDTAMHLGIVQSITQGNFPPQAPYFSGHPLTYYYFTDFHTAILATLTKSFFPQILILDNPFCVLTFFLALYAFAFYLTKSRRVALLAGWLGVFNGSFIFIRFFEDLVRLPALNRSSFLNLLANRGYTMEYQGFFQMVPMADYFLQNRPMMVGLPSVVLVSFLLYRGFKENQISRVFLAGLIASLTIKFQLFAYGASLILFFLSLLFFFRQRKQLFLTLSFFLPFTAFSFLLFTFSAGNQSLWTLVKENLSLGPWDTTKSFGWYLRFYPANLGISLILSLLTLVAFIFWKKNQKKQAFSFLFLWLLTMGLIPVLVSFTIYAGDMFKFFYLLLIPAAILAAWFLGQLWSTSARFLVPLLLLISSFTAFLTLSWSFLNKRFAYSQDDLQAGLWIRNQTPPRSVFVGLPTVHSPITQIGGRLRVLSYINWPYSHGFNRGEDNVFRRQEEIKKLYSGSNEEVLKIMNRYQVKYVFYGPEERNQFPEAETRWKTGRVLKKVYHQGKISIYRLQPLPASTQDGGAKNFKEN